MVKIEDAIVVKYEKHGHFEVLADPDKVLEIRQGKSEDVRGALASFEIFKDAKKAEKASEVDLEKAFETVDIEKIAKTIIQKGEFHLTTDQKRQMLKDIRNRLIELVRTNSLDPRTKLPHTRERIEWGFENAKINVELKPAEEQLEGAIKKLRPILPISFGTVKLEATIPAEHAPHVYGKIMRMGTLKKEEWLGNGSLKVLLEVPAGRKVEVISELGNVTKGDVIVKEV